MSTEDFTAQRKRVISTEFALKGASSVKKRPFLPTKLVPLVRLDFNEIKREVAASETYERNKALKNSKNSSQFDSDIIREHCNGSKEVSNENVVNNGVKREDSFDLDFSTLSIHSPVKKDIFETPNTKTIVKRELSDKFNNFVTPKCNDRIPQKIHCSVPRNSLLSNFTSASKSVVRKTDVNQNNANVVYSIPRTSPEDKILSKLKVNSVEYLVLNLLGKGGSSKVYQCVCLEKKTIVAIKCVSLESDESAQGFINEVNLLYKLRHCDKIIKLFDYQLLQEEKKLFMVLEQGGDDLSAILKAFVNQKIDVPFYMIKFYWMEMLLAVKQIHLNGVIHSDIKPSNFLSTDKGLKLIDFGISAIVNMDMTSAFKSVPEGSCNYLSPEALNNDTSSPEQSKYKLHYKSDVWSLGCILYELVYKKTPFQHIGNLWNKLAYIVNPNQTVEYPVVNRLPPKIVEIIKQCLQYNVKSRPSVDELLSESYNF